MMVKIYCYEGRWSRRVRRAEKPRDSREAEGERSGTEKEVEGFNLLLLHLFRFIPHPPVLLISLSFQ